MRKRKVSITPEVSKESGETDVDNVHARTIDLDNSEKVESAGEDVLFYRIQIYEEKENS